MLKIVVRQHGETFRGNVMRVRNSHGRPVILYEQSRGIEAGDLVYAGAVITIEDDGESATPDVEMEKK